MMISRGEERAKIILAKLKRFNEKIPRRAATRHRAFSRADNCSLAGRDVILSRSVTFIVSRSARGSANKSFGLFARARIRQGDKFRARGVFTRVHGSKLSAAAKEAAGGVDRGA